HGGATLLASRELGNGHRVGDGVDLGEGPGIPRATVEHAKLAGLEQLAGVGGGHLLVGRGGTVLNEIDPELYPLNAFWLAESRLFEVIRNDESTGLKNRVVVVQLIGHRSRDPVHAAALV